MALGYRVCNSPAYCVSNRFWERKRIARELITESVVGDRIRVLLCKVNTIAHQCSHGKSVVDDETVQTDCRDVFNLELQRILCTLLPVVADHHVGAVGVGMHRVGRPRVVEDQLVARG